MRTPLPFSSDPLTSLLCSLCLASLVGCNAVPYPQYRQAQMQALEMHKQNQVLAGQLSQTQQLAGQLQVEKQQIQAEKTRLELATNSLNGGLDIANQRLLNLTNERGQLHEKYRGLLAGYPGTGPVLPGAAIDKLHALAQKYPDFDFDPVTGLCRFTGDLLFDTGSDSLRPQSHQLLQEFTRVMNDPVARDFKILVVGHTDDRRVVKPTTKQNHPTNWDLSAHRATAVVKQLAGNGLAEHRMGVAGYSRYQPAKSNSSEAGAPAEPPRRDLCSRHGRISRVAGSVPAMSRECRGVSRSAAPGRS